MVAFRLLAEMNPIISSGKRNMSDSVTFLDVGPLTELPEKKIRKTSVGDLFIAFTRIGSEVFAFQNECPHAGAPLDDGELEGCVITCSLHMWKFNIQTGAVVRGAAGTLKTFPTKIENGNVFIGTPAN